MEPKGPNKRIRAKGWFLTWPKCPIGKEMMLEELKAKFDVDEYVICEEEHKDGEAHLHAFLKVKKKIEFKPRLFDVQGYHGEYQVAKSWRAVVKYVRKDGNFISNIDTERLTTNKHVPKMKKEDLLRDVDDVLDAGLINPMQVNAFYKNSMTYKMLQQKRTKMPDKLPEKKRHLWFYGASNTGKTYKLREMMKETGEENWFQIPTNNDWIGYAGEKYLYIDEFKGQISIQMLNAICDGNFKVNVKGGSTWIGWDIQVIVCSNFSIRDCYSKVEDGILDTLYNRFNEKELIIKYS